VLALTAAACSESSGGTNDGSSTGNGVAEAKSRAEAAMKEPTKVTQTVPLKAKAPTGKTVVNLLDPNPDSSRIAKGIEDAATALGWTFSNVPFDPSSPASLQQAFATALSKNADLVTEAGMPQTLFGNKVLSQYKSSGALILPNSTYPVTAGDTIVGDSKSIPNGYYYNEAMGKVLADWFIADSNGKGTAVFENVSGYPSLKGVTAGFKAEVKALCPECKVEIVDVAIADMLAGQLQDAVVSAVRRNPDTGYVFFDNGAFGVGIETKLSAAGLSNLKIGGVSPQPAELQALRAGKQHAWTAINMQNVGWAAMDLAVRSVAGEDLTTNNSVQPTQLLTPENAPKGDLWDLPQDGLQQYSALWNISK
jgi:ribose transport system substrate-binding protein